MTLLIALALIVSAGGQAGLAQDYGRLDTKFDITVTRTTDFPPGFQARFTTTTSYPCVGYEIRSGLSWQQDTLTIRIGGFLRPSPCYGSMSEARGELYLGELADGRYVLRIEYRGEVDEYVVRLTRGMAGLERVRSSFTKVVWK